MEVPNSPNETQKYTNILLLGGSGVGKTTFVNSLINYITFGEDYNQAKEKLHVTINMEYTKYDDQTNPWKIVLTPPNSDDASNENSEVGNSRASDPRCYSFKYGTNDKEKYIRIIDTPGLLDCDGVIKDGENLQKILSYLRNFSDLHAICILMKPIEARLTVAFKYCIKELLSRLHKDAAKNIVYCFTNTQMTNFTPGDTLEMSNRALTEIKQTQGVEMKLDKDNVFCFENDGFRYFAAQKFAGFPKTGEEEIAQKNWVVSANEAMRLFQTVAKLPSYDVRKSLAIYLARGTLKSLAKPMAELAKNDRLDSTLQMLRQQSAAFAAFVRKHSLVVTNDAFSGYIDLCIQSAKYGSKQDLTQKMEEFKEKYEQELESYKNSGSASESLTFENINEKLEELLNDPVLGIYLSSIKEFLDDTPDSSKLDKGCSRLTSLFGKMTV